MTTDEYIRATNAKRFVIEDSITKVTSDGEPHEMMTMIAVLSGLVAAIVILAILISLVGCRKARDSELQCDSESSLRATPTRSISEESSKQTPILTIYQPSRDSLCMPTTPTTPSTADSTLSHYNASFVGSELNLQASLRRNAKTKKKTHWQDEIVLTADDKTATLAARAETAHAAAIETKLDMERY